MARGGAVCYQAKEMLERQARGAAFNPVVLTSDQEDDLMNRKVWNNKYKLWKLKSSQPQLFANIEKLREAKAGAAGGSNARPGFERVAPGWLLHTERQLYVEEMSQRLLWYDATSATYVDFHLADDCSAELALAGSATTASASKSEETRSAQAGASAQAARNVLIMDLHKAADMCKFDLTHIDRPAAMLAVYKHAADALAPEIAAKGLHEKLLRRLAGYRGYWSDEDLQAAVLECMAALAAEQKVKAGIAGGVSLILGARLVVAASHGAACAIADALPGDMKDIRIAVRSEEGSLDLRTACIKLDPMRAACVLLHTERIDEKAARSASFHAEQGHQKAGAVALLQGSSSALPGALSRAGACVHLAWTKDDCDTPVAKRPKTEKADKEKKVRCRQILLKYAGCRQAVDPVRRKPVCRSLAEAEAAMLDALTSITEASSAGGAPAVAAAFTKSCRAISECKESLRGGDLAGDVGWLRLPEIKPGEKLSKEVSARLPMIRAAVALQVNEISDIIVSDDGVRLLKREA